MKSQPAPDRLRPSSARKREALLDAAEQVFLRDGYDDARMDEIAERSGVAKQTAYSHFASKRGLFTAVVRRLNAAAAAAVHTSEGDPRTPDELAGWLRAAGRRQLDAVLDPRVLALRRLVIGESRRHPDLAAAFWEDGPARSMAAFADAFGRLHAAGILRAPDPTRAAEEFNWLVMGQSVNAAMLLGDAAVPGARERDRIAASAVEVFLAGRG